MQRNPNSNPLKEFKSWIENPEYFEALRVVASLSRLFSEEKTPMIEYRSAENLFIKYFGARNNARKCDAYDAILGKYGIGIKTFGLNADGIQSTEKIAEFNKLQNILRPLCGEELATQLAIFRNERMFSSDAANNISDRFYHVVGRLEGKIRLFNTDYEPINVENIKLLSNRKNGFKFSDGIHEYSYNYSKSTLFETFTVKDYVDIEVDIIDDPLEELLQFYAKPTNMKIAHTSDLVERYRSIRGKDYVILPLYSTRDGDVPKASGLNQWNAKGRARDPNEVYVPIPVEIRKKCEGFFPGRDERFHLHLQNGDIIESKVCQDGGKALMSCDNSVLGTWLLRSVLRKKEGDLVTKIDLDIAGFDSIEISKKFNKQNGQYEFYLSVVNGDSYESYEHFIKRV